MKFSVGDLVVEKIGIQAHTSFNVLKVVAILNDSLLLEYYGFCFDGEISQDEIFISAPGTRSWRESYHRYLEEELFSTQEALEEIHKLQAAQGELNKEFDSILPQLEEKLNQAAALVKEAAAMALDHNTTFYYLKDQCMPLYLALNQGGWSHSHMEC
jgi:hypothetical protein